ncbi:response regulator transcription factor [Bacillus sp. H-16]|uniref:helix-turn-helix domain-containing protein n=1 Tax=Alteribacter salitolerans TaxID=2912333 RepID=UPI001966BC34|nr:helix-turn-helix domain-containing protein [Alteribacter salitolerans]MBM7095281.1 response regulator transcription factor [Alteribacter salitolerans]
MPTLLIADRDHAECQGLKWFAERSSQNMKTITPAHSCGELLAALDGTTPDVLILELDLLSDPRAKSRIMGLRETAIIATTAEPTFEKAMQALHMNALDLLIKPHAPARLQALLAAAAKTGHYEPPASNAATLTYDDLFVKKEPKDRPYNAVAFAPSNSRSRERLSRFFREQSFSSTFFTLSDWTIAISDQGASDLAKEANRLLDVWNSNHPSTALAAILYTPGSTDIHHLYQETKQLIPITFYKGYRQLFAFERPLRWKKIDPFLTPNEQREWVDMLAHRELDRVKDWLYSNLLHSDAPYPEPQLMRTRLTSILAQVRRYMRTYRLDRGDDEAAYEKLYGTILHGPTLHGIVQDLYLFIQDTITHVSREPGSMDAVERGILYINAQYQDPKLSLSRVGQAIGQSPGYFSEELKKREGMSFRPYLTRVRLKKAESLLRDSTLSIKETAAQCGFISSNYFARTFRQHRGVSPKACREAYRRENHDHHTQSGNQ